MTVTRADLENKLREITDVIDETADGAKNAGVLAGVGAIAAMLIAYLLGRRKGRKRSARVEVYRVG
jgi:ABC-type cobalt transport system substrate-binding protein